MTQISFQYQALDRSGTASVGIVHAANRQDAYRRIAATGLTPTKIIAGRQAGANPGGSIFSRKIKGQDVANFTYQLSVLLEARIPVVDCFRSIAGQESNPEFRRIILEIAASVQQGRNITDSLAPYERVFGRVYLETIRAAEKSGNMIKVLSHLAEATEDQVEMKRTIRGALMYPLTVVCALTAATLFLVTFIVPKFAKMFRDRNVPLPALTEALDAFGSSVQGYWYVYIAAIVGVVLFMLQTWRSPQGRAMIDRYLHLIPYVNGMLTGVAVGRFAGVFGLSLGSGLGLLEALDMSGRATARPMLMDDVQMMIRQVKQGGRLGDVLVSCTYMPPFVKQLLRAGEESAELTRMCQILSRHYTRETRHMAKNIATIVEPILIAGLTGVVLVIALAIFLPMWNMVSLVG